MTSQEKKKYLSKYQNLDSMINRKLEECEKWRDLAEKITPTLSDMPKSQISGNRVESAVEHIVELEQEINRSVDELVKLRKDIESSLQTVKDDTLRKLLEYRYIDGMTWEEIAVKMNYTYQWVCELHGRALQQLKTLDSN